MWQTAVESPSQRYLKSILWVFNCHLASKAYWTTRVYYHSYWVSRRLQYFGANVSKHIDKISKLLKAALKSHIFDRSNLITILSFLPPFLMASNMVVAFFRKLSVGAFLRGVTFLRRSCQSCEERKYYHRVSYLLYTCVTNYIIAKVYANITSLKPLSKFQCYKWFQTALKKGLHCIPVWAKHLLRYTFVEVPHTYIQQNMKI